MLQSQCLRPAFSHAKEAAAGTIASYLGPLGWAHSLLTTAGTGAVVTKDYTVGLPSDQATGHPGYKTHYFVYFLNKLKQSAN